MALLLVAPLAAANWPSFHGNQVNSGFVRDSGYEVYKEVWWNNKTEGGAQFLASPVLKDGTLVVADTKGLVRGLDAESGKERWRHAMGSSVEGTPAIEGERVYVASVGGKLVALNLFDGHKEHETSVGATRASISVHENKLYVGNEAGQMKAYLADSLTPLWTFSVTAVTTSAGTENNGKWNCPSDKHPKGAIRTAPLVFGGKVFFGSTNYRFYAVDADGDPKDPSKTTIRWWYQTDDVILSSPALSFFDFQNQYIIVGSYDGKVYRFVPQVSSEGPNEDPCRGTVHPSPRTFSVPGIPDQFTSQVYPSKVHASPAVTNDRIYVGANNGHLYAIDVQTMNQVWDQGGLGDSNRPLTSSPAVANGTVVIGSEAKKVFWIDASDGSITKDFDTESGVTASPALVDNRAFVAGKDGTLYMFGPDLPPRPDLIVTALSHEGAQVHATVQNSGGGEAGNSTLRVFKDGAFARNVEIPALQPGQERSVVANVTFRDDEHSGSLRVVADATSQVQESDEANNERTASYAFEEPEPTDPDSPEETEEVIVGGGDGNGDDEGVPGPGIGILLAGLAATLVVLRRRR